MSTEKKRIGTILLEKSLLTEPQLERCLAVQKEVGQKLGQIIMTFGYVRRLDFYQALADALELEFVELLLETDPSALTLLPEEFMRTHQVIPFRVQYDGTVCLATIDPTDTKLLEETGKLLGRPIEIFITSDLDVMWVLQKYFRREHIKQSVTDIYYRSKDECANEVLTKGQFVVLLSLFILNLYWLYDDWKLCLVVWFAFVNVGYLLFNGFKLYLSMQGVRKGFRVNITQEQIRTMKDEDLPIYTILIPLYREPEILPTLVQALRAIDYPKSKLDIKILFEEDDTETLERAKQMRLESIFSFVAIPESFPKTKPKACNYGLLFARGKYLTIFDAEDIPDPFQLKKALLAFESAKDPSLVSVQAALNYFNSDQNFLTKWFTLEYTYWFEFFLPGLDRIGGIIPLGGTSNHFITEKLRELGAWDPFNVTEDADLGVRLAERGYKTAVVNSVTYEEANCRLPNWIRQRSRWIKGYTQTYLVHMRHPFRIVEEAGWKNLFVMQMTIGSSFVLPFINPIMWAITIWWIATRSEFINDLFPGFIYYVSVVNFLCGNFLFTYLNLLAVIRAKKYNLIFHALLSPAYWGLISIATFKGLYELVTTPFYWQKTQHGFAMPRPTEELHTHGKSLA